MRHVQRPGYRRGIGPERNGGPGCDQIWNHTAQSNHCPPTKLDPGQWAITVPADVSHQQLRAEQARRCAVTVISSSPVLAFSSGAAACTAVADDALSAESTAHVTR
jgi:hypothetical protein